MIVAAAVCPHPPLLFRELTGAADVAADLRAACVRTVSAAVDGADDAVVIAGAGRTDAWDPGLTPDVRRFGTTGPPAGSGLPLGLGVGRMLLEAAGWSGPVELRSVAADAPAGECRALAEELAARPGRTALLVLGDASARRGERAPGHLDERAAGFDADVVRALGEGDAAALAGLDAGLAAELLVAGRAAFAVLGEATRAQGGGPARAEVVYADDPFGVMYVVARWRFTGA